MIDLSDLVAEPVGEGEEALRVVGDGVDGTNGEGEAAGEGDMLEEDLGGKKEDMECGGLDSLLVAGEDAIEVIGDGEEAEDGSNGNIGGKNGVAEAEYRGVGGMERQSEERSRRRNGDAKLAKEQRSGAGGGTEDKE